MVTCIFSSHTRLHTSACWSVRLYSTCLSVYTRLPAGLSGFTTPVCLHAGLSGFTTPARLHTSTCGSARLRDNTCPCWYARLPENTCVSTKLVIEFLDFNVLSTAQGHPRTNKPYYQSLIYELYQGEQRSLNHKQCKQTQQETGVNREKFTCLIFSFLTV